MADDLNMGELLDNIAVAGQQNPDIRPGPERTRERRGDGSEPAHPDEVIHFCRDKENVQQKTSTRALGRLMHG
jgi:hypothetical protein